MRKPGLAGIHMNLLESAAAFDYNMYSLYFGG